jgi:hypothetical protein
MYGLLDKRADSQHSGYVDCCSPDCSMGAVKETGKVHRFEQEVQELQKRLEIAKSRLYKPLSIEE